MEKDNPLLTYQECKRKLENSGGTSRELFPRIPFADLKSFKAKNKPIEALTAEGCPNLDELIKEFSSETISNLFRLNLDLILVVVEVNETLTPCMSRIFDCTGLKMNVRRCWIIQVTSKIDQSSLIFFQDLEFSYVIIVGTRLYNRGPYCEDNRFDDLLEEMFPKGVQHETLSLLDVECDFEKLKPFAEKSKLCKGFLSMKEDLMSDIAVKKSKTESDNFDLETEDNTLLLDSRNYNMLMMAIEEKGEDLAKYLLTSSDFDLAHRGNDNKRAVDLALENEMFGVLLELFEADSPFPENLQFEMPLTEKMQYEEMLEKRKAFHELIENGSIEEIKTFVANENKLKFAYDRHNKSALTKALESEKFEVYALLQHEGFAKGVDPSYDATFKALTEETRNQIAEFNLELFATFTSDHVNLLINQTKLASKVPTETEAFKEIWGFYNELDGIPEVSEILKVVALHDNLTISFDFESTNVSRMHPAQSCNVDGVSYAGGFIYISAWKWQSDRSEVLGVIAHEFTHCAMFTVYANEMLPYRVNNEIRQQEFLEIVNHIAARGKDGNPEETVWNVFEVYPQTEWPIELIVRVPHLLSKYRKDNEKLEQLKAKYEKLFQFFETKTLPDVSQRIKTEKLIEKLNAESGLLKLIEVEEIEFDLRYKDERSFLENDSQLILVCDDSPIHLVASIASKFFQMQALLVVTDLKTFGKHLESIRSELDLFVIINCANQSKEFDDVLTFLRSGKSKKKIFLVALSAEKQKISEKFFDGELNVIDANISWQCFSESYKNKMMEHKIMFHDHQCTLREIIGDMQCPVLECLPLAYFVGGKQLSICEGNFESSNFYVERKFFISEQKFDSSDKYVERQFFRDHASETFRSLKTILSCNEVLNKTKRNNIAILSGIAGTGKSTALREITKCLRGSLPFYWVGYVDLKRHVEFLREAAPSMSFTEFASMLVSEKKKIFERKLFKHLFGEGKALILLDGFDEISPFYKQIVLDFVSKFQQENEQKNQLWITTRSHLKVDLENVLKLPSYQLLPFVENEKIDFLLECWKDSSNLNKSDDSLTRTSTALVKRLTELLNYQENFIGIPLLLKITGETYKDKIWEGSFDAAEIADNFNLFSLYREFVDRMVHIWTGVKGLLSESDQSNIGPGNAVKNVHWKIAMKHSLAQNLPFFKFKADYDEEVFTKETLARVGLVRFQTSTSDAKFLHETFADFFIAQVVVQSLRGEGKLLAIKIIFIILVEEKTIISQFLRFAIEEDREILEKFKNFSPDLKLELRKEIDWEKVFSFTYENKTHDEMILSILIDVSIQVLSQKKIKLLVKGQDNQRFNILKHINLFSNMDAHEVIVENMKSWLSEEEIQEKMFVIDERGETCLHRAAWQTSSQVLRALFAISRACLSDEEQQKLFTMRNLKDRNVFHCCSYNKNDFEMFSTLMKNKPQGLAEDEIKSMLIQRDSIGLSVVSLAADICDEKSFDDLYGVLRNFFSIDELYDTFFGHNNGNDLSFHSAALGNSPTFLKALISKVINSFPLDKQRQLFKKKGLANQNIFTYAACNRNQDEVLSVVLVKAKTILEEEEIKAMLLQNFESGFSVLSDSAPYSNESSIEALFELLREFLSPEEIVELICAFDNEGDPFFHRAAIHNTSPVLRTMLAFIDGYLNDSELKALLTIRAQQGRNIFIYASLNENHTDMMSVLREITLARRILSKDEIKAMVTEKGVDGANIISVSASFGNENSMEALFENLKFFLDREEICAMICDVNPEGNHCLSYAATFNSAKVFQTLLSITQTFLPVEMHRSLFEKRNKKNRNIFLCAAANHECVFAVIFEKASQVFTTDQMKSMFKERDDQELNMVSLVAIFGDVRSLQEIFEVLRAFLSKEEVGEFFFELDIQSTNCLHQALMNNSAIFLKTLLEFSKEFLSIEKQRELLRLRGLESRSVFFYGTVNNTHKGCLPPLMEQATGILPADEIKSMLLEKYGNALNFISVVATFHNETSLIDLFAVLKEVLSPEELKAMIFDCQESGDNCIHNAAIFNSPQFVRILFGLVSECLSREELRKVFTKLGQNNRSCVFLAIFNEKHEGVLPALVELAKEILEVGEIKSMLTTTDVSGSNIVSFLISAECSDETALKNLFKVLTDLLTSDEIAALILDHKNPGKDCLRCVTFSKPSQFMQTFFKFVEEVLSAEQLCQMLILRGTGYRNILRFALLNSKSEGVLTAIIKFAKAHLDPDLIKGMLLERDSHGSNLITIVAENGSENVFDEVLEILSDILDIDDIHEMFCVADNDGDNCLNLAIGGRPPQFIRKLFNVLNEKLQLEMLRGLLIMRGSDGSIFQCVSRNQAHEEVLEILLENIKPFEQDEDIQMMLSEYLNSLTQ